MSTYADYHYKYHGFDFINKDTGERLTKGQLWDKAPDTCKKLLKGDPMPEWLELIERE